MSDVRETRLPGVGIRYDFTTDEKRDIGVLVHHDGRREVVVYDEDDPDRCSSLVHLSESDSQTLGEILGVSHVAETVSAVRQEIEGLSIAEAAAQTGQSESLVKVNIHRGLKKMSALIESE